MNFSIRISSLILIVASCTMTLLTVLMHFKYHVTRSNLVIERLDVTANGIAQPINNSIKLGLDIDRIQNIPEFIRNAKKFDSIIKNIIVFQIIHKDIKQIASVEDKSLLNTQIALIKKSMRESKNNYWHGVINEDDGFSGVTIKNIANQEKGAIVIFYDLKKIHAKEKSEIRNLYRRLAFGLFFALLINFIAIYQNTAKLTNTIELTEQSILDIFKNMGKKVDLGKIDEPVIKTQMRAMVSKIMVIGQYINKIESFLTQAKSNKLNKEDKNDVI